MRQMEHIGKALERFLKGNHLERRVAEYQIVLAWKDAVGVELAAHSEARDLTHGVLWVTVSGSSWAQHIMFLKPKILEALRREFPGVRLSDIRCVVGGR